MDLQSKKAAVEDLSTKFGASTASFFVSYQGSSCESLEELRQKLRVSDAKLSIVKNTLTKRSLAEAQTEKLATALTGPTAVVFSGEDPAAAAKAVDAFAKDSDFVSVKAGILEGEVISSEKVAELAKLPSKEELLAKLLSLFNAPAIKLLQTISAPGAQLVRTLGAVKAKIEEEGK